MTIVVQKYGGSSVANTSHIREIAERVATASSNGTKMAIVVSAMGKTTNDLIELASQISDIPDARELDALLSTGEIVTASLMAMTLNAIGTPAISLTGAQAGIQTDETFGKARIANIDPSRIKQALEDGKVVVVAGFQGITEESEITTLGRGGSDTTAVALAISLGAARCEIYTDVDGIYTADPRIVPKAKKMDEIIYEEMLEFASYGAKMHPRSIELGAVYNMPIIVASSFADNPGTLIHGGLNVELRNKVRGIASDLDIARVTVLGVADQPGIAAKIFDPLADSGISVDVIVQNASENDLTDLSFTIAESDLERAIETVNDVAKEIDARGVVSDSNLAKVTIVGTGMQNSPGYASLMFRCLYESQVNIEMITTSEIRITCIINKNQVDVAVAALHTAFELDS
jgi:aspartate kinase